MNCRLAALVLVVFCMTMATPALAQENPYRHAGDVTELDIPVPLEAGGFKSAGSSGIEFRGAGYTHRIGRVSIAMNPVDQKHDGKIAVDGNLRRYSTGGMVVEHEVYRDLVKERIILDAPASVRYSYDLALSDWVTLETDESRPVEARDANNTVIVTYPYTKEVTNYAKDSTIDIGPDRWGNLVVYVNGEDVVVMPKPFAIDAAGKRFEMDFRLDKKAKTITVAGDLTGAQYPVTVDPTERVTNGGFELGCWNNCGWSNALGNTNSYTIKSDSPYQGNYYLDVIGTSGYSGIRQTALIDYTGATSVSNAAAIPVVNIFDIPMSDIPKGGWHWLVNAPGQYVQGWTPRSTSPGMTGQGNLVIWTYSSTHGHIDSVSVIDPEPPIADFTGTPLSGTAPLTVQFTDWSTNAPTSWEWDFGDGGTSALQNPSHQYTSAETYTVSLTAANVAGSDGETKTGYVVVTSSGYPARNAYVEAGTDGICVSGDLDDFRDSLYYEVESHGWQDADIPLDIPISSTNARVKHWLNSTRFTGGVSHTYLDKADFAYFHGHGNTASVFFDNADPDGVYVLTPVNARWGSEVGGLIKWITFHSCLTLNQATWTQWIQSFNGLHMVLGYDTESPCKSNPSTGLVYAQLMRGEYQGNSSTVMPIREAWKWANWYTVNNELYTSAMMYVTECHADYLPGFGAFGSNCMPTRDGAGNYGISYENWNTDPDTCLAKKGTARQNTRVSVTEDSYSMDITMEAVPETVMIYIPTDPVVSREMADKISRELGISGRIAETTSSFGTDRNSEQFFSLQKNVGVISYQDLTRWTQFRSVDVPQNVPSDEQAVQRATQFLTAANLLPKDALVDGIRHNPTETVYSPDRKEISRETTSVIYSRELNGLRVENSKIMVEIGGNSDIISLFMNWRDYVPYKEVTTKPVDAAFREFTKAQLRYQLSKGEPDRIVVTGVILKYYAQVAAAAATEKYLQPVYVFEGYVQRGDESVPFQPVYVPATIEQFDNIPDYNNGVCE